MCIDIFLRNIENTNKQKERNSIRMHIYVTDKIANTHTHSHIL